jgi:carbonic anhydrase/acetyltransferase-like protein (isoleucine patch superfamily)
MKPLIREYNGTYPTIAKDALIAENAVITGDTHIGKKTNIWYGCVIRGDLAPIRIGDGTNVQDGTIIHVSRPSHPTNKSGAEGGPCIIGKGVTIGHLALLHACVIEDYAFIGMKALVMDMAKVESHAMVAAGAVITPGKTIKYGEIWAGNPGKLFRKLSEEEMRYIKTSESNYIKLAEEYFGKP